VWLNGLVVSIGVNPLVSTLSGHPQFLAFFGEREGVGGKRKERGKGGKEGGHSLIFTWIDARHWWFAHLEFELGDPGWIPGS